MSRVQLALNVSDLEASVDFYRMLFDTEPHKLRPGYANFEIAEPPLKLVLMEVPSEERGSGVAGALNHVGVELAEGESVAEQIDRLDAAGLDLIVEQETNCCHAVQDKVWASDPSGTPWEFYRITDDAPDTDDAAGDGCCLPDGVGGDVAAPEAAPEAAAAGSGAGGLLQVAEAGSGSCCGGGSAC